MAEIWSFVRSYVKVFYKGRYLVWFQRLLPKADFTNHAKLGYHLNPSKPIESQVISLKSKSIFNNYGKCKLSVIAGRL